MSTLSRTCAVTSLLTLVALTGPLADPASAQGNGPASTVGLLSIADTETSAGFTAPANITSIYNQVMNFVYNTFRSRERMIQLTLIGVVVGLFIMLRRMPGKV